MLYQMADTSNLSPSMPTDWEETDNLIIFTWWNRSQCQTALWGDHSSSTHWMWPGYPSIWRDRRPQTNVSPGGQQVLFPALCLRIISRSAARRAELRGWMMHSLPISQDIFFQSQVKYPRFIFSFFPFFPFLFFEVLQIELLCTGKHATWQACYPPLEFLFWARALLSC